MNIREERLREMLYAFGISVVGWGMHTAKSLTDLLQEIDQGESTLVVDSTGLSRHVSIVRTRMFTPHWPRHLLRVVKQVFPDGRTRDRDEFPTGKIQQGESAKEALIRELGEELQLDKSGCLFFNFNATREMRPSPSYPGLPCVYDIQTAAVKLQENIPDDFLHQEFSRVDLASGSAQTFRWVPESDIQHNG